MMSVGQPFECKADELALTLQHRVIRRIISSDVPGCLGQQLWCWKTLLSASATRASELPKDTASNETRSYPHRIPYFILARLPACFGQHHAHEEITR